MSNNWCRVGDFYHEPNVDGHGRKVVFIPVSAAAVISRIEIRRRNADLNEPAFVDLTFSPAYTQELLAVCQELSIPFRGRKLEFTQFDLKNASESNDTYPTSMLHGITYHTDMELDKVGLGKLIQLFDSFNKKMHPAPFSDELVRELCNMHEAVGQSHHFGYQHILPMNDSESSNDTQPYQRPDYETLADVLAYHPATDKYKMYLTQGDNPNGRQKYGSYSALTYAMLRQASSHALALLLWYKADPFSRALSLYVSDVGALSAFELAIAFNQHEKAGMVRKHVARLDGRDRMPDPSKDKPRISYSTVTSSSDAIESEFHFDNHQVIRTQLKPVVKMSKAERDVVYHLVKNNFETPDKHVQMEKIFNKDFSGKKLIDLVLSGGKLVGFNLLEIVRINNAQTFLHCAYAAIMPEYRGYGLMKFLSFRLAYMLKQMNNARDVGIIYFAAHYNSYRLAPFFHYPRFQYGRMQSIFRQAFQSVYPPGSVEHHHHYLTSYIVDELRVKESASKRRDIPLNEQIYTREILDLDDAKMDTNHTRSAPVVFLLNDDNYQEMRKMAAEIGIDFDDHISRHIPHLPILIDEQMSSKFRANL